MGVAETMALTGGGSALDFDALFIGLEEEGSIFFF